MDKQEVGDGPQGPGRSVADFLLPAALPHLADHALDNACRGTGFIRDQNHFKN
jgi:hypothetical protein